MKNAWNKGLLSFTGFRVLWESPAWTEVGWQRNAKRGIAHTVSMTQTQRHIDKVEVLLQRGGSPHKRGWSDSGYLQYISCLSCVQTVKSYIQSFDWMSGWKIWSLSPQTWHAGFWLYLPLFDSGKWREMRCNKAAFPNFFGLWTLKMKLLVSQK